LNVTAEEKEQKREQLMKCS